MIYNELLKTNLLIPPTAVLAHKSTFEHQQLCVARGSRLEGKRCVTRISDDKCAIM